MKNKKPNMFMDEIPEEKINKVLKNSRVSRLAKDDTPTQNYKTRKKQIKKTVFLPDDLNNAWLTHEFEMKKIGEKINFQSKVESLLRKDLKRYL